MLNVSHHIVGGRVETWEGGRKPLPWLLVTIEVQARVWDQWSNRAPIRMRHRICIQGVENMKVWLPLLHPGLEILAIGQVVPASVCAADKDIRGQVTLASVIQPSGVS